MWKIRTNFSHLYSPIRPRVSCLTDYNKREKFNDIPHGKNRLYSYKLWHTGQKTSHVKNPTEFLTPTFAKNIKCKVRLNMSNMRNMIEYFTDVNNLTKFVKVITYSAEYITCEKSDRISHTYILPKCVTCKKFDRICHLWGTRSNTLQLWNYGKKDLIRHTVATRLTENITWKILSSFSHL